jgi:hypothetical protein
VGEIREDVEDECGKCGEVTSIFIPRPSKVQDDAKDADDGVGFIFVEFSNVAGASKARTAIAGRSFNGNTVFAQFFPHDLYTAKVCASGVHPAGHTHIVIQVFKVPEGYSFQFQSSQNDYQERSPSEDQYCAQQLESQPVQEAMD